MKSLIITAVIVSAAAAALIIYLADETTFFETKIREPKDMGDAAEDAYKTMNKHIGRVERNTEKAFNALS
jgi:hypothetical protein